MCMRVMFCRVRMATQAATRPVSEPPVVLHMACNQALRNRLARRKNSDRCSHRRTARKTWPGVHARARHGCPFPFPKNLSCSMSATLSYELPRNRNHLQMIPHSYHADTQRNGPLERIVNTVLQHSFWKLLSRDAETMLPTSERVVNWS